MGEVVDRSIACPIGQMSRNDPDRIALYDDHKKVSYAQLNGLIDSAVANLVSRGLGKGDVVGVLAHNSLAFAVLLFAAWRLGFILMPLNWRLTPDDWREQIGFAGCRLLLYDRNHVDLCGRLGTATVSLDDMVSGDETSPPDTSGRFSLDREALLIFSSGTTGTPRGIVLTWANLYYSAMGTASILTYRPGDIWIAALPFFHIGGMSILFRTALGGSAAYIMDFFDAERAIDIMTDHPSAYISVVSTMLSDLIRADENNILAKCRGIILGGAGWDDSLISEIKARRLPALTTYGLTETSSMVTLLPPDAPPALLSSSGKVLPYREIKIIADDGSRCEPGETGRIAVRGEVVFARYLGQEIPSRQRDGWFLTDDLGTIDNNGYLIVVGRADTIIVSGGENIDLNQIERVILRIPGIAGVVVLSRPDARWGARPVAFVEDEAALKAAIAKNMPKIMIPDRIKILENLPRTGSGKYDRAALRRGYPEILANND